MIKIPKISVLVPVYNIENVVKNCLESLKKVDYKNLEIIFVDDASTDGSLKLIKDFCKENKNTKIIIHKENKGLLQTRIDALKVAKGEFIAFLDGDDSVDSNLYSAMSEKMISEDADICLCEYKVDNKQTKRVYSQGVGDLSRVDLNETDPFKLYSQKVAHEKVYQFVWNKMISRRLLKKCSKEIKNLSKTAPNILMGEDIVFSTLFTTKANKMVNIHGAYYYYAKHTEQSIVLNSQEKFARQFKSVLQSFQIVKDYLNSINRYDEKMFKSVYGTYLSMYMNQAYKLNIKPLFEEILAKFKVK